MVVHAGRDQEVAHAVHAGKKGVCRLVRSLCSCASLET